MRRITVYEPGSSFPSVSVTGTRCALSCDHCCGKYLKGMRDISPKGSLYKFGIDLWERNGSGILISGGCDPFGAVDFPPYTFEEIRKLKEETGLLINLHSGLVGERVASSISTSGVDKVSFDLVYDDKTIRNVLHLDRKKGDFIDTLTMLREKGVDVAPHILAGLDRGVISWEHEAVEMLSKMDVDTVVLIILIPTKGTRFQGSSPPPPDDILDLAARMRSSLKGRLVLGCMRPKGYSEIEVKLLGLGFDGIVLPGRSTLRWMASEGHIIERKSICCCMDR
ncbi:MAG: radical SAM protein [Candidatus Thermoplasmatota archaeon]|nr:radical SAM protein [Candidatus Thermoplasmatota archaeon]